MVAEMLKGEGMFIKILIGLAISVAVFLVGLVIAAKMLSGRIEPLIRAKTIEYLEKGFDSDVEIGELDVTMAMKSPVLVLLHSGKGVQAHVTGTHVKLWHKHRRDVAPLIALNEFSFQVELYSLLKQPYRADLVRVEGLHITVPPREKAPIWKEVKDLRAVKNLKPQDLKKAPVNTDGQNIWMIDTVICDGTTLTITPREANQDPLEFDIRKLRLRSAGPGLAMAYEAELTNPKPRGLVFANGHFGPWNSDNPSETPLDGIYDFQNAELGVFKGIAGRLNSTGKFTGNIDHIIADGETRTADFRLTMSGKSRQSHHHVSRRH